MQKRICVAIVVLITLFLSTNCLALWGSKPELNEKHIDKDLIGQHADNWKFKRDDLKSVRILDSKYDGDKATVYVFLRVINNSGTSGKEGKLRLYYEWAAKDWNLIDLKTINFYKIDKGNLNGLKLFKSYPLHLAAALCDIYGFEEEIANGADVNEIKSRIGFAPLHLSAVFGCNDIVKLLLKNGADPNLKTKIGKTPLSIIAGTDEYGDNVSICKLLISKGADVNAKDKHGYTPLMAAGRVGNVSICKLLISKGADVNTKDKHGHTPLMAAAKGGNVSICKLFISKGANVNAKDKPNGFQNGWTPLFFSIYSGHPNAIKFLIEKSADMNVKDGKGYTPLYWAMNYDQPLSEEITRLLKKAGAKE